MKYQSDGAEVDVQPTKTITKQINVAMDNDIAPIDTMRSSLIPEHIFIATCRVEMDFLVIIYYLLIAR